MKYTRLFFLVLLTMTAFAFNSILARLAISNQKIGPVSFALLRLLSGSIILIIIVSVSIFGLLVFVFVKNYIKSKINNLIKEEKKRKN